MEPQRTLTNRERAIAHAREQLDAARATAAEQPREPTPASPGNSLAIAPQSSSSAPVEIAAALASLHDRLDAIVRRLEASELERSKPLDWESMTARLGDLSSSLSPEQAKALADTFGALFDKVRPAKRASAPTLDAVGALTDEELRPIANECEVTVGQVRAIGEWLARLLGASNAP